MNLENFTSRDGFKTPSTIQMVTGVLEQQGISI